MEDLSKRQQKEAEEDRVDYEVVDTEVINDARHKRKRNRKEADPLTKHIADDDDQDDDDFRMNLDKADEKYRVKRKKKYLFNDAGIKIEPFKMDSSVVENHGGVTLMHEGRKDSDEEDDPWYESIKQQQEEMLKENVRKQIDSEEDYNSSEDDNKAQDNDDDNFATPGPLKIDIKEVISLKKKLIDYLEAKENVEKALKRLKQDSSQGQLHKLKTKKKNIRKRQKVDEADSTPKDENMDQSENDRKFDELMEIVNKLFDLKYLDVYRDDKESIEYEIKQDELKIQREEEQRQMKASGW